MRVPGWQQNLAAKVEEWRFRSFRWGDADCIQFVADCIQAATGNDPREKFPKYRGQLSAARFLARYGGMEGLLTTALGDPKPIAFAQEGDIVMGDFGNGLTAGVCVGVNCCSPGAERLEFRPTLTATTAWSV